MSYYGAIQAQVQWFHLKWNYPLHQTWDTLSIFIISQCSMKPMKPMTQNVQNHEMPYENLWKPTTSNMYEKTWEMSRDVTRCLPAQWTGTSPGWWCCTAGDRLLGPAVHRWHKKSRCLESTRRSTPGAPGETLRAQNVQNVSYSIYI